MDNPFLTDNTQPYNSVPFELIKSDHFLPAVNRYIKQSLSNIDNICNNPYSPSFENTIVELESASDDLNYVTTVYMHMFASEADQKIKELINEINPLTTKLYNDIYLNEKLFKRIEKVYSEKDKLNDEDSRLVEEIFTGFIRSGAKLDNESKKRYREISQELSALSPKFSNNVLSATNKINDYWIQDENYLSGLPTHTIENAKNKAIDKQRPNEWCFSLDTDSFIFLKFCSNREVRKDVMVKTSSKCNGDEFDNNATLKKISLLRQERAKLLGFDTHADYVLNRRMANSKKIVYDFIDQLMTPSFNTAKRELIEISNHAKRIDNVDTIKSYDMFYYGQQLKEHKYDFNEEILRPYFKSENVLNGAFDVARKLYGLDFNIQEDLHKFHEDVKVYKVEDSNKKYIGLLYVDLHPRKTKRGGAWMNQLRSKGLFKGKMQEPHVTLNCNLTRGTDESPALLSINEVRTIFHEFGHCLHGLLTDVKYSTLGAMGVYWDFVELPSQLLENWLKEEEVLNIFAKHYKTGESIPKDYIDKINETGKYMSGTMSLRQLHLCKIDMAWHDNCKIPDNVEDFEKKLLKPYTLIDKEDGATVSNAFSHIFAGGYSSGYYSYKWAELLEADAFEKFKSDGIFNKETADSFKNNVLSKGNTKHPMELFKNFMGREPKIDALLRKGGLSVD